MGELSDMAEKAAEILKPRFVEFTLDELKGLHRLVDHAHRATVAAGDEQLVLKDMEARLASIIEAPVDEMSFREAIVALLPEQLQSAARRLIVYHTDGEHVAVAIWCDEDVLARAKERGMKISQEQAQEIVDQMDRKQDCELGITWTTIDCYLDDLKIQEVDGNDDVPKG